MLASLGNLCSDHSNSVLHLWVGDSSRLILVHMLTDRLGAAMAYVNEPPVGAGGTNVYCTNGATADELLYVATQTIMPGAEVFVDYGLKYDRTHYGGAVCEKRIAEVYAEPKENSSVDGG